jgi:hypothetical protein
MSTVTAGMNGVRRLYHYQRFNPDRLRQILSSNSIYLSNTRGFNDPWDCRPFFDLNRLDEPAFYVRQVKWFERVDKKHNPHLSEKERAERATRLRNDRAFLEHCIRQMVGIESEIQKRYRVYCLTTKPTDTLMWSHYSENHTGICLEFRCDNGILSSALKVVYYETYPSLDLADDDPHTILLPLLAKAKDWSYEDEYRLIAQEESAALNLDSLITKNNLLRLPNGDLPSVVVGCVASTATRDAVCEIVRSSGNSVPIKQAVRVPDHYALKIEDLPSA